MKVRYIYSACVVIETADLRVCCDPWFTQGIYDGAWYHYPPLVEDPVDLIGPVTAIYISHIHPDHYDPLFLRGYLARYPRTRLLIGACDPPHLLRKMRIDGFVPEVIQSARFGGTSVHIVPNMAYEEVDNIDTALVIEDGVKSVVNMNDSPFDQDQIERILALCPGGHPTMALLPYAGAGPYPQTYYFATEEALNAAVEQKKRQFLDLFKKYVVALRPERALPFAGKYVLGGPLATLNSIRGIADAVEAWIENQDVAVVLDDGGRATFDLATMMASATRSTLYSPRDLDRYLSVLPFKGYNYVLEIQPLEASRLPVLPLLKAAYERAAERIPVVEQGWLCLWVNGEADAYVLDLAQLSPIERRADLSELEPRVEIAIDSRYLFGLLTRLYHWNNAEIGSHYRCRRVPDHHDRRIYGYLHRFHV